MYISSEHILINIFCAWKTCVNKISSLVYYPNLLLMNIYKLFPINSCVKYTSQFITSASFSVNDFLNVYKAHILVETVPEPNPYSNK